jgi:hypothetical protein
MDGLYGDEWLPCSMSWWSSVSATDFTNPGFLKMEDVIFASSSIENYIGFEV